MFGSSGAGEPISPKCVKRMFPSNSILPFFSSLKRKMLKRECGERRNILKFKFLRKGGGGGGGGEEPQGERGRG